MRIRESEFLSGQSPQVSLGNEVFAGTAAAAVLISLVFIVAGIRGRQYWIASIGFSLLARISHHPSTATAPWRALAGFRSVGVLDIVSTMPARSSVTKATQATPLHRLATNGGEKCGLVGSIAYLVIVVLGYQ